MKICFMINHHRHLVENVFSQNKLIQCNQIYNKNKWWNRPFLIFTCVTIATQSSTPLTLMWNTRKFVSTKRQFRKKVKMMTSYFVAAKSYQPQCNRMNKNHILRNRLCHLF
ncbi:AAEL008586-PA [Aedes aegypti]|uniref:AAEL008586-PA n=1 Tax=Aedes aegypti TaxID=7159 RepID=Q16YD7_AEDAE|nr:AAEL008586-PA [Aedes aegypti]